MDESRKCQIEKDKYCMISLICGILKKIKKNENRNIDTKYNGTVLKCQSGGEGDLKQVTGIDS